METLPSGVKIREFYSPKETREEILRRVKEGFQKRFPMENDKVRIEADDIDYDKKKMNIDLEDELKAVLTGGRLSVPLRGKIRLIDKVTNRPIDEKEVTLANVPHMNDDGLFVMGGTQYVVSCFHPSVQVWTENGNIPIGEIVRKKMTIRVWSYDFDTSSFVLKPIVNWWENKAQKNLICSEFSHRSSPPFLSKKAHAPTTLWSTQEHKLYTTKGQMVQAVEARSVTMVEEVFDDLQTQLVFGSLLGDAHLTEDGIFQTIHCTAQREYAALKHHLLGNLRDENGLRDRQGNEKRDGWKKEEQRQICYFRSRVSTAMFKARKLCYPGGEKRVSQEWLDIVDERGVALWFLDDGSVSRSGSRNTPVVRLHTNGFNSRSIQLLREWLKNKWGVNTFINRKEKLCQGRDMGWIISTSGPCAEKFLDLVAPYVPSCMQYKLLDAPFSSLCKKCQSIIAPIRTFCSKCLLDEVRESGGKKISKSIRHRFGNSSEVRRIAADPGAIFDDFPQMTTWRQRIERAGSAWRAILKKTPQTTLRLVEVPSEVMPPRGRSFEKTRTVYDIEVEGTHNYFANGILVSNCQSRLKPGIYARTKDNGELESHFSVAPGTGASMRLSMEPETGVFRTTIDKSSIKLYPVLRALGVPDEKLRQSWGDEILKKNQDAFDRNAFGKFYGKLLRQRANPDATDEEKKAQVLERLAASRFDPEVNSRTLGKPYDSLSTDVLSDASAKLLHISRGEQEEDDRDHPANRTFHSVDDFMADRVRLDAGKLGRTLLYRATYDRSLKHLSPGYFTPQLEKLIVSNQLSQVVPGLNPMEIYDQHNRVIQLGEGGVSSVESIPVASRNLQAGQLGMIDPIRSSESMSIGVDQRFTIAARKGDDNHVYYPARNLRTGKTEYVNPVLLHGKTMAFPAQGSLRSFMSAPPAPPPQVAPLVTSTAPAPITPPPPSTPSAVDMLSV